MAEVAPAEPSRDAALARATAMVQRGAFEEAAALVAARLEDQPDDPDALYLAAVCQRYLKRPARAQEALTRLLSVVPDYGRGFQEQGHLFRLNGDDHAALEAYRKAVERNPALPASWQALRELHARYRDPGAATRAEAQFRRLASLPAALVSVSSFFYEGKLLQAERLCRRFLREHPHHLEAMRLLANIGAKLHVLDDAEFLLESALAFDPDFLPARVDYVHVLHQRQKYEQALAQARMVRAARPGSVSFDTLFADQCMAVGEYSEALEIYDTVLERHPRDAGVHLARGHALKTVGRQADAVAAYRAAYGARADFGDAYWSLANLKTYRFPEMEVETMRVAVAAPGTALVDRYHLNFALGKALEDRADYAGAFACFERGNALKKQENRYRPEELEAEFVRQTEVCTRSLFERLGGAGCQAADPIFIVGLPRAGSTLLEQVLASHSQVDGTYELPNILALVHRLRGRGSSRSRKGDHRYPGILAELEPERLRRFGEQYISDTRQHRRAAPFFTDKMPNNFRHLGLIALILPRARIIDARRHPLACCVSAYKQLFAQGQEFSYDLEDLGRYYRHYVALMKHWDEVLPGRILRVTHEDVVTDFEGEVRRLLAFLELPFEPECLEFYRTRRSVRTASSEQVRQPINDSGLDQWRHYEPWLDPLKEALGTDLTG